MDSLKSGHNLELAHLSSQNSFLGPILTTLSLYFYPSMEGSAANLPKVIELKKKYKVRNLH